MEGSLSDAQIVEVFEKLAGGFYPKNFGLPAIGENNTKLQWFKFEPERDRGYLTQDCELDFLPFTAEEFYTKVMLS